MISKKAFFDIIQPLILRFGPPESPDVIEIDYRQLSYFNEGLLARAVERLLATHQVKRYPLLAEFMDAIELEAEAEERPPGQWQCGACRDSGFIIDIETGTKASFCTCECGIRKKAGVAEWLKSHDIKRTRKAYDSADISGAVQPAPMWTRTDGLDCLLDEYHEAVLRRLRQHVSDRPDSRPHQPAGFGPGSGTGGLNRGQESASDTDSDWGDFEPEEG